MKKYLQHHIIWMTFFVSSVVMLLAALVASSMMVFSADTIGELSKEKILALSRAAANLVPADELDKFITPEDMQKPEYRELKEKLYTFNLISDTEYTYYLRLDTATNMMQFIADNTLESHSALSSKQVPRERAPDIALTGTPNSVPLGSYSEGWEGYLTAFAPVYYSDGSLSNIVAGVDILDVSIKKMQTHMHRLSLLLFISMVLVLGSCSLSFILYNGKVKQALIASEAKNTFMAQMSHEIRTPLSAIIGLCELSNYAKDLPAAKSNLSRIAASSQHLLQIVDDVLDISKIESGTLELEIIPANIRQEIAHIENIMRPLAREKNQQLFVAIGDSIPESGKMDVIHLRQIITNLLSNAIKFTPKDGYITLSAAMTEVENNRCNILWCVEDTGIGIPPEKINKLFHPFEQVDTSTTREQGGVGLGLSISKHLVEMMGGTLQVESTPGKGSKFTFNIWVDKIGSR